MSSEGVNSPVIASSFSAVKMTSDENQNEATSVNIHPTMTGSEDGAVTGDGAEDVTTSGSHGNEILRCLVCKKISQSHTALRNHVAMHICNVPVYQCKCRRARFNNKQKLLKHLEEHLEEDIGYVYKNSFVCTLCGRGFDKKSDCMQHLMHHKRMVHNCATCGWTFETSYRVQVHAALWHSGPKRTPAKRRVSDSDWTEEMSADEETMSEGDTVSDCDTISDGDDLVATCFCMCDKCQRNFRTKMDLEYHLKNHAKMIHVCPTSDCEQAFEYKSAMKSHCKQAHNLKWHDTRETDVTCATCNRPFRKQEDLDYHTINHDQMEHVCQQSACGWAYEKFPWLASHSLNKHGVKLLQTEDPCQNCAICGRSFSMKAQLENHVRNHDSMIFVCEQENCGWAFDKYNYLRSHLSGKHGIKSEAGHYHHCAMCNRSFSEDEELQAHVMNHDKMTFVCEEQNCGHAFKSLVSLRNHSLHKHTVKAGKNKQKMKPSLATTDYMRHCTHCSRGFQKETELQIHEDNHDKMVFVCEEENCGWAFKDGGSLKRHKTTKHKIKSTDCCTYCNRVFQTETGLQTHVDNHDKMVFVCDEENCRWAFKEEGALKRHKTTKHKHTITSTGYKYSCALCNRTFKMETEFEAHVDNHDKMVFVCEEENCGFAYDLEATLKCHKNKKHNITPIPNDNNQYCTLCNRGFYKETELQAHVMNHHKMVFVCEEENCGCAYEYESSLKNHKAIKHNIKTIPSDYNQYCPLCNRGFQRETELQAHVKNHDKMVFVCREKNCGFAYELKGSLKNHKSVKHKSKSAHNFNNHAVRFNHPSDSDGNENSPLARKSPSITHDSQQSVNKEIKNTTTPKKPSRTCHLCGRFFNTDKVLEYHLRRHELMKFVCQYESCRCAYELFYNLQTHYKDHHPVRISTTDAEKFEVVTQKTAHPENKAVSGTEAQSIGLQKFDKLPAFSENGNFAFTCTGRKCSICKRYFTNDTELEYHVSNHDKMQHRCQYDKCGFMYEQLSQLNLHYDLRHKKNVESKKSTESTRQSVGGAKENKTCTLCYRRFGNVEALDYHMNNHDQMRYMCQEEGCTSMFEQFVQLQRHCGGMHKKKMAASDSYLYLVGTPPGTPKATSALNSNQEVSSQTPAAVAQSDLACLTCGRIFNTLARFASHLQNHHNMKYKCQEGCGHMYIRFELLRNHYYERHKRGISIKDEHVYLIEKALEMDVDLSQSEMKNGSNGRAIAEVLNMDVDQSENKDGTHIAENIKVTQIPKSVRKERTCKICNRYFNTEHGLDVHLKNHSKMKYRCQLECGYMYQKFDRLKLHCRDKHKLLLRSGDKGTYSITGEQALQHTTCPICKRKFKGEVNCAKHIENHIEMVYSCEYCKWLYEKFEPLSKHYERRHGADISGNSEVLYRINPEQREPGCAVKLSVTSCVLCARKFHLATMCAQHMDNHEKMVFKCKECGWMYKDFEALRGHYFRAHNKNVSVTEEAQFKVAPIQMTAGASADPPVPPKPNVTKSRTYKQCPICSRKLLDLKYDDHVRNHDNLCYKCPDCGSMYEQFYLLYWHCSHVHKKKIKKSEKQIYQVNTERSEGLGQQSQGQEMDTRGEGHEKVMDKVQEDRTTPSKIRTEGTSAGQSDSKTCSTCERRFLSKEKFEYHTSNHDKMVYRCFDCGSMYEEFRAIQVHCKTAHDLNITLQDRQMYHVNPETVQDRVCRHCQRKFKSEEKCAEHVKNHDSLPFKCPECDSMYEAFSTLQMHCIKSHKLKITADDKKMYTVDNREVMTPKATLNIVCHLCQRRFGTQESCAQHIEAHDMLHYKCSQCAALFKDFKALQSHSIASHQLRLNIGDRKNCLLTPDTALAKVCHLCSRKFKTEEKFAEHLESHDKLRYKCLECGAMYVYFKTLQWHSGASHQMKLNEGDKKTLAVDNRKDCLLTQDTPLKKVCHLCQRKFKIEDKLTEHIETHDMLPYKCLQYGALYEDFQTLQKHCAKSHQLKLKVDDKRRHLLNPVATLKCHLCKRRFQTGEKCAEHVQNHDSLPLKCLQCGFLYEDFRALQNHCTAAHQLNLNVDDIKMYTVDGAGTPCTTQSKVCHLCSRKFRSEEKFADHIETHDTLPYKCLQCGALYEDYIALRIHCGNSHQLKLTVEDKRRYLLNPEATLPKVCHICPRKFKTEEKCAEHIESHDLLPYKCVQCGAMYEEFQTLQYHCIYTHNSNVYIKDKEKYQVRKELAENIVTPKKVPIEGKLPCPTCSRKFASKEKLKVHVEYHASMKYKCIRCGWMFKLFRALITHYQNKHAERILNDEEQKYRVSLSGEKVHQEGFGANVPQMEPIVVPVAENPETSKPTLVTSSSSNAQQAGGTTESSMLTHYKCFRCRALFETFNALQDHYSIMHSTVISESDASLCKIQVPAPAPQTSQNCALNNDQIVESKESAVLQSLFEFGDPVSSTHWSSAGSPRTKEDPTSAVSSPGAGKRKRLSEEEVLENIKKRRRTASEESSSGHGTSPEKRHVAGSPVVKIGALDRERAESMSPTKKEKTTHSHPIHNGIQ